MSEYVRGERLRKFCEENSLRCTNSFDEGRNRYIFTFWSIPVLTDNRILKFSIEMDGTRYIAQGEISEIELVQVAMRKLNQLLQENQDKPWYDN